MNFRHPKVGSAGLIFAAALIGAVVVGCKNKESQVVGTWNDPKGQGMVFKADKTFSQAGGPTSASGTWSIADNKVSVNLQKIGSQSVDEFLNSMSKLGAKPDDIAKAKAQIKAAAFTLSEDGKTMSMSGGPTGAVTLTKVESK